QRKVAPESGQPWPGAPRSDLMPGMGAPRGVAQARTHAGITASPLLAGQLPLASVSQPIEPKIRQAMEAWFQTDSSTVRRHHGPAPRDLGARALTLGETLYFAPGQYDPRTPEGIELLGHELTHVVQQRAGRIANPFGHGVAIVQDPALEAEAYMMGRRVADE